MLGYILLHYLTNNDYSMLQFSDVTQNIRTVYNYGIKNEIEYMKSVTLFLVYLPTWYPNFILKN